MDRQLRRTLQHTNPTHQETRPPHNTHRTNQVKRSRSPDLAIKNHGQHNATIAMSFLFYFGIAIDALPEDHLYTTPQAPLYTRIFADCCHGFWLQSGAFVRCSLSGGPFLRSVLILAPLCSEPTASHRSSTYIARRFTAG